MRSRAALPERSPCYRLGVVRRSFEVSARPNLVPLLRYPYLALPNTPPKHSPPHITLPTATTRSPCPLPSYPALGLGQPLFPLFGTTDVEHSVKHVVLAILSRHRSQMDKFHKGLQDVAHRGARFSDTDSLTDNDRLMQASSRNLSRFNPLSASRPQSFATRGVP